ncbi:MULTISPECIES: hypothetical protein [unclassified Streptomyces]|uniref:hypothetical protein n=1 Tax=unclassified Streptomyces TaxID=2593676 RepID=UPI00081F69AA|nr:MULTISPECIES: hypothetical protein [unclassified Streptomyces]MYZ34357.1 hypothetical protein [Streptomyces sp. SID4917]SCF66745.1 hypothetical protein GA0115259_1008424 [Streptomyces sp. MnatMP-M17]
MQSNNHTRHPEQPAKQLDLPQPPPAPKAEKHSRTAALRTWWNTAWAEGGMLHARWEDLRRAPKDGWHGMATWVKTTLGLAGFCAIVILLNGAADVLSEALYRLATAIPTVQIGTDTSTGVLAVVDQPVRTYIAQHSAGLAVSASALYALWQLTGITALVLGWLTRNNGVRLTWTAWGAGTVWMVWTATPHTSRPVAAGLAVLAWTLLSAFALRGLTLRRRVGYPAARPATVTVRPEIHILALIPVPAAPGDDHTDTVRPFQR